MAKKVEKTELQQTKNSFKFIGQVTRLDKDGAFKQEEMTKGKMKGKTYRSLRFGLRTSETNEQTVQMFDFEPEEVFLWNSEKHKEAKKRNEKYKGKKVPYSTWLAQKDELAEQGYAVLQSNIALTKGEDGKMIRKGLPSFVASEMLFNGLYNGDTVSVEGRIRYSIWENPEGKKILQKQYNIERLTKIKDVDFHAEDFEEITYFEQEFVFIDAVHEKAEKKVFVVGRTIDYSKKFQDVEFVVDYSTDEDMAKMASAFTKKFSFGDVLSVFGDSLNRVIVEEADDEDTTEEEDLLASLGGKSKPKHAQRYTTKSYVNEMQIHGLEAWDKKVYTEDDFVVDELVVEEDKKSPFDDEDDFGGKKKKNKSPFEDDEEDDDGDLPF